MSRATQFAVGREHTRDRAVELVPQQHAWSTLAIGAFVPLGMAAAAALVSNLNKSERAAMTAWIAVAVVGTASVVAAGAASRRRTLAVHRDGQHSRKRTKSPEE